MKRERKPCGIVSTADCDNEQSCRRCMVASEFLLDMFNQERLKILDDIEKLPILLRSKEKSIIDLKTDITAMREYMKRRENVEEPDEQGEDNG